MGRSTPPPKPWLHHGNHSASSLTGSGMEVSIPPSRRTHSPALSLSEYSRRALPPVPKSPVYQELNDLTEVPRSPRQQLSTEKRPKGLVGDPRQTQSTSAIPKVKAKLPPPPQTPMSRSSRKVLQLTGFNPNYERTFIDDLHLYDASSSDVSSGSEYSQDRDIPEQQPFQNPHENDWKLTQPISTPLQAAKTEYFLENKVYSSSESSFHRPERNNLSRATSLRSHINSDNVPPASSIHSSPERLNRPHASPTNSPLSREPGSQSSSIHTRRQQKRAEQQLQNASRFENPLTYEELVAQERARLGIDNEWEDDNFDHTMNPDHTVPESALYPRPLEIRPRKKLEVRPMSHFSDHSSESSIKKPSRISSARNSFTTGMRELASPTRSRHARSPDAPSPRPLHPPPSPLKTKRKGNFATGNHPLKSPYPFRRSNRTSSELRRKVSGAMKRVSGSGSPKETTIIANSDRSFDGPDTPLPKTPGSVFMKTLHDSADALQKGNSQILGVVKKAKKTVRVRTPSEKRRDDLKKTINVIGHSDQTPDGRVAEWV